MGKSLSAMAWSFGIAVAITAAVLFLRGADNKSIRLALELTARWSFLLFWLAYIGGAAALLGVTALAGRGRELGLSFAAAHLVHVFLVVWLYRISPKPPLGPGLFLFFAIGLFFIYLLALLSMGGLIRRIGPTAWRWVRLVGMNYILIAFARDFFMPILFPKPAQMNLAHYLAYAPFAVMAVAAPLLVMAARRARPATI